MHKYSILTYIFLKVLNNQIWEYFVTNQTQHLHQEAVDAFLRRSVCWNMPRSNCHGRLVQSAGLKSEELQWCQSWFSKSFLVGGPKIPQLMMFVLHWFKVRRQPATFPGKTDLYLRRCLIPMTTASARSHVSGLLVTDVSCGDVTTYTRRRALAEERFHSQKQKPLLGVWH